MKKAILFLFIFSLFTLNLYSETEEESLIQIAILLDTSSSMSGLIDQAKSELWKIVNELSLSKKNGKSPRLEVALYEYGNDSLSSSNGYIRLIVPLTVDLDKVSDELFKLTTNGGEEYCGTVINESAKNLKWSKSNNILKMIFIAGNEPFTQGNINYKNSCKDAISKGIIVNTIFCGDYNEGVNTLWKDGAEITDGSYASIDQNKQVAYINTPMDDEIVKLGNMLNSTYIAFGAEGESKKELQSKQDKNAMSMNEETIIQRSVTKSKSQYNNSTWDIVDALKNNQIKIENVKDSDLPKEMQKMTIEERTLYIQKKEKERAEIQEKINKLNVERTKYIENEKKNKTSDDTLDAAVIKSIKSQAAKKNYIF